MQNQTFDYIIIGAGSAGCVLANRLSADKSNKVLLLEAGGPDKKFELKIPAAYGNLHRTEVDWSFWTAPQSQLNDRKVYIPRGKVVGGCSSTNAMAYVRGNKADYNEWAALGNKGWGFDDVLPYFKKSEHHEDFENPYHAKGGLLNVSKAKSFQTPFAQAFVNACIENGIENNEDYNGEKQEGAGLFQFTIKNGERHSVATAFLKPALKRPNLTVITNALVKEILIDNDKAVGVTFLKNQQSTETVYAQKEIILSAGSFQSPQILMLSGVGPKQELEKFNIPVKKDLAGVGQNLQDHLCVIVSSLAKQQEGFNHHLKPMHQAVDLVKYLITKKGILTCSPLEAVAFLKLNQQENVDFQFHFTPIQVGNDYVADPYNPKTYPKVDGYSILTTLLKPKSRGFVALNSGDAMDAPLIQPQFLSDEEDLKTLVKGAQKALETLKAKAFDAYNKEVMCPINQTEEGIIEHIKKSVETIYHPVGTCKMGNDELAVVNDQLQVIGLQNLRVVDASIMPTIVAGNTNAAVIMIAEKAADMILNNGNLNVVLI